jgi:hypothetical protein
VDGTREAAAARWWRWQQLMHCPETYAFVLSYLVLSCTVMSRFMSCSCRAVVMVCSVPLVLTSSRC